MSSRYMLDSDLKRADAYGTTPEQQYAAGEAVGRWAKRTFSDPVEAGNEAMTVLDALGLVTK